VPGARWRVSSSDSRRRQNHAAEPAPHLPGFLLKSTHDVRIPAHMMLLLLSIAAGTRWGSAFSSLGSFAPCSMRTLILKCHMISREMGISRQANPVAARSIPDRTWQAAPKAPRPRHAAGVEAVHVRLQRPVQLPAQADLPPKLSTLRHRVWSLHVTG
jgi:hypothetical protein